MELTKANYFSPEANKQYMSVSQFKAFMKCEAEALAELNGETSPEPTTSLLVGSYVDAYFSDELTSFKCEHPEIFKRDGTLKSEYHKADNIIARIERDELFMEYLDCENPQTILTGELFGYYWKIKVDALHEDKIVDLKIMKDFELVYVPGEGKMHFIEAWGYDIQGAIYQQIVAQNNGGVILPFYIAAATKETDTDLEIFEVPQEQLDVALNVVKYNIDRIADIKAGLEEPIRCDRCSYCKQTKKLTRPINYKEVVE